MECLQKTIDENTSVWDAEFKKNVISILQNWKTGEKRPRQHYNIHDKYELKSLARIDSWLMATKQTVITAIKDTHVSIGHLGEKKNLQKVKRKLR